MEKVRLGVIINPVAGIGGKAGLKGSDGEAVQRLARERGAVPEAPSRALAALRELLPAADRLEIVTCPGEMGEEECRAAGLSARVLEMDRHVPTTAEDTAEAARRMAAEKVRLILFAGGDGTARDLCRAVGRDVPALGIPAGVKIHSAVFGADPRLAGRLACRFLTGQAMPLRDREVLDLDEEAYRGGRLQAGLYGYLRVPFEDGMVQHMKAGSSPEQASAAGIARAVTEEMEDGVYYVIGAGTTTQGIFDRLGQPGTLLGVDVVLDRKTVGLDLSEQEILALITGKRAKIVISPIGGQGYLFGRGNQQLSREVLDAAGTGNIIVAATPQKLADLDGRPFRTDLDGVRFPKYIRVVTGYRIQTVWPIAG